MSNNIIRWRPMVPDFFDDFDKFFASQGDGGFMPALDVYQTDSDVMVEASLPGIDADQVEINVENDVLTIAGSSEHKSEVDDKNYYRREVRTGSFHRSVALPAHVNADEAEATYEKGVLTVRLPKLASTKNHGIKITKKDS